VAEIKSYPELVDSIWTIVQGTPEERERVDFMFSEEQVASQLGIPWAWESDASVFGVAQAISYLVDLEYCKGIDTYNGRRWRWISPSPNCPNILPSASFLTPPIAKLPPFRLKALQFIHEQTLRYEEGITFYDHEVRLLVEDVVYALLPLTGEADKYSARGQVFEAMLDLEKRGFVRGSIAMGAFTLWITLKGACWLLVGQPLLQLSERAKQLVAYPEAAEAAKLLMNAHSETPSNAAQMLYIATEKLENAVGGERRLAELLGQSRTYVSALKQSLQPHRHAATQAQSRFNHRECLTRMAEIIEKYITLREQSSN